LAGRLGRRLSLYALILAAGSGSRFGGGKLMAPWRDGALIDGALAAAKAAPVRQVLGVVGADPRVTDYLRDKGVVVIEAEHHAQGLSASLKAGIAALPKDASGVIVFLGDMPLVPTEVVTALAEALASGAPAAVPVLEGRIGNPAAFSTALFSAVLALEGDRGARMLLEGLGEALVRIPTAHKGVLIDVDRPDDLPA
jgi:molybdenum cofactor cytidylyltransferase